MAILLGAWGPCTQGASGGGGGTGAQGPAGGPGGMTLEQALAVMGFPGAEAFTAWLPTAPSDETFAAGQQLLELLTQ